MIYLKTDEEIEMMRQSNLLVGKTLGELAKWIAPGITTLKLDRIAYEFINDNGERIFGHGTHCAGAVVRRHTHLFRPLTHRRAHVHLLHGHTLQHHTALEGLFKSFVCHTQGHGLG